MITIPSGLRMAFRVTAATTLTILGALHLAWATGAHWPASSGPALADAVIGGSLAPAAAPTAVVGGSLVGSGLLVGAGRGRLARAVRLALGVAFVARMLVGGATAARALGVANPSATFRRWDRRLYRPLCGGVGLMLLADATSH